MPLFWPARLEVVLVYNRGMRVPYGSPREFGWLGLFAVGALALLPLSSTGFAPWFHRLLGTTYGAVEDYLSWRDAFEVWADVHGHNLVTGEEVDARYRIVDALHTEELVVEDDAGRAYRVGLGQDADITVTRVTAWRGNPVTVRSEQVQVVGRSVAQLIAGLPGQALRIHLTGTLKLEEPPELPAVSGRMRRVGANGAIVQLRAATPGELALLSRHVIEDGSVVVRSEFAAGTSASGTVTLPAEPGRVFTLRLPDLPDLAGLVVQEGDEVVAGQPVARYIGEAALARAEAGVEDAERVLEAAEAAVEDADRAGALEARTARDAVVRAQREAERVRGLVAAGAAPRTSLVDAEERSRDARAAEIALLTKATSDREAGRRRIDEARVRVRRARDEVAAQEEAQWVRTPVAGKVLAVHVDAAQHGQLDAKLNLLSPE